MFDFAVALTVLTLALPVLLVVTIILYFANDGKPFFFQTRPGKNEKLFRIVKFKTMNDKRDANGKLLPDAQRLTPVGTFVRKTSLDELPQLLNVLLGQMSLIGPRPLLVRYLPYFTNEERLRFSIRPGITGWAQVNGRNNVAWDQRLAYDVYYAKNISFALDAKILWMTVRNVASSKDIVVDTSSTLLDLDEQRKHSPAGTYSRRSAADAGLA